MATRTVTLTLEREYPGGKPGKYFVRIHIDGEEEHISFMSDDIEETVEGRGVLNAYFKSLGDTVIIQSAVN